MKIILFLMMLGRYSFEIKLKICLILTGLAKLQTTAHAGDDLETTSIAGDDLEPTAHAGDDLAPTAHAGDDLEPTVNPRYF